jgi:hypothetical protein
LILGVPAGTTIRLPYGRQMTIAANFIADLQAERKIGNVSYETEQHLKHEFRKLGRNASGPMLAAAVEAEIERLETQAVTLRRLILTNLHETPLANATRYPGLLQRYTCVCEYA